MSMVGNKKGPQLTVNSGQLLLGEHAQRDASLVGDNEDLDAQSVQCCDRLTHPWA
jgi:hypothetical protein